MCAAKPRPPSPVPTASEGELDTFVLNLGRLLFFETRLSCDGSLACATCHDPSFGRGDGLDLSRGYPVNVHWRNSPTIVNSGYLTKGWLWTGEAGALDKQAGGAMGAALIGNMNHLLAEERLRQIPVYVDRFDRAFGEPPSAPLAFQAIAEFERSLISDDSPFDLYMRGDEAAMSEEALRGMDLFEGKAGCIACTTVHWRRIRGSTISECLPIHLSRKNR
ncbi:cytochrome-c peroxidase [Aestuariibius insulae]|uniref:cytochrome-c peroxidase n=1 Tax=Aestuariibius insulae TaxID=2058287 RepID=UPI00398E692E